MSLVSRWKPKLNVFWGHSRSLTGKKFMKGSNFDLGSLFENMGKYCVGCCTKRCCWRRTGRTDWRSAVRGSQRRKVQGGQIKGIRICLFFITRRSDKGCDRNERANFGWQTALRWISSEKRRQKSSFTSTVHAKSLHWYQNAGNTGR